LDRRRSTNGIGGGFSFEWPVVDAMQVCMYKTVGSTYHVVNAAARGPRRQLHHLSLHVSAVYRIGALGGMQGDLAGGVLVGQQANYVEHVAGPELKPSATLPVKVFLASGTARQVSVPPLQCVRREDNQVVLDETARGLEGSRDRLAGNPACASVPKGCTC